MHQNNLKNSPEIEIKIEDGSGSFNGLWCGKIGNFDGEIMLWKSRTVDFNVETLEGFGCFLHQLNHEYLHVIIARLEGYRISVKLDDLRDFSPEVSHRFAPFF